MNWKRPCNIYIQHIKYGDPRCEIVVEYQDGIGGSLVASMLAHRTQRQYKEDMMTQFGVTEFRGLNNMEPIFANAELARSVIDNYLAPCVLMAKLVGEVE
jgi:hypothetical protein